MTDHPLRGLHILVAEDMVLVLVMLEEALEQLGCELVGPAARVEQALQLARNAELDGAILDVNLDGEMIFPAAEALDRRDIPLIFATGYDDPGLFPDRFASRPRLQKPFDRDKLERLMVAVFGDAEERATRSADRSRCGR